MCLLLVQLIIGFISFFAAAVYSTNEANKVGLKQSIFLDVYGQVSKSRIDDVIQCDQTMQRCNYKLQR